MPRHNAKDSSAFRAKSILSAIFMMFLIFGYQNCGVKKQGIPQSTGNRKVTPLGNISPTDEVKFIDQFNNSGEYTEIMSYKVNLQSSTVTIRPFEVPEEDEQVTSTTCPIDASWQQTLVLLFQTVEICQFDHLIAEGTICTQPYTYPHTVIRKNGATYKLGEESSGCPQVTFDICQNLDLYLVTVNDFINDHRNCSPVE